MPSSAYFLKYFRVADLLLWDAAIAGLLLLYAVLWKPAGAANELQVMVDNQLLQRLALSENQQLAVQGKLGESIIEVRNGQARFVSSPCRNQVCVHHGWAQRSGELLACLPNRIALVLSGNAAQPVDDIDAVNF